MSLLLWQAGWWLYTLKGHNVTNGGSSFINHWLSVWLKRNTFRNQLTVEFLFHREVNVNRRKGNGDEYERKKNTSTNHLSVTRHCEITRFYIIGPYLESSEPARINAEGILRWFSPKLTHDMSEGRLFGRHLLRSLACWWWRRGGRTWSVRSNGRMNIQFG